VEAGSGDAVLLVHGSLCDYRYWRPQLEGLSARRRVIAVSLRRYWPEAWDGGGEGFSLQTHADDLAALIEALDTGPVDLVGHSRGGTVAWMLAQQHPARLRSLVLADPGLGIAPTGGASPIELDRGDFRRRAMRLVRGGDVDGGLALFTDTVSGAGTWERMVPGLKGMMRDNANTLIAQATERPLCVSAAAAQALRLPTLLVGGAHSPAPYPAILDALAALLPNARRASIPGASHAMNLWNPRAFNQAMESFLSTL
jgi:pimeloyl-ACP methyl ester carboxylesterase